VAIICQQYFRACENVFACGEKRALEMRGVTNAFLYKMRYGSVVVGVNFFAATRAMFSGELTVAAFTANDAC
jgi:uncharacterized phage protein gp47/JayE